MPKKDSDHNPKHLFGLPHPYRNRNPHPQAGPWALDAPVTISLFYQRFVIDWNGCQHVFPTGETNLTGQKIKTSLWAAFDLEFNAKNSPIVLLCRLQIRLLVRPLGPALSVPPSGPA